MQIFKILITLLINCECGNRLDTTLNKQLWFTFQIDPSTCENKTKILIRLNKLQTRSHLRENPDQRAQIFPAFLFFVCGTLDVPPDHQRRLHVHKISIRLGTSLEPRQPHWVDKMGRQQTIFASAKLSREQPTRIIPDQSHQQLINSSRVFFYFAPPHIRIPQKPYFSSQISWFASHVHWLWSIQQAASHLRNFAYYAVSQTWIFAWKFNFCLIVFFFNIYYRKKAIPYCLILHTVSHNDSICIISTLLLTSCPP